MKVAVVIVVLAACAALQPVAGNSYVVITTTVANFTGAFQTLPGGIDAICQSSAGGDSPIWHGFLQNGTAANFTLSIPVDVDNTYYNIKGEVIAANVDMATLAQGGVVANHSVLTIHGDFVGSPAVVVWTGQTSFDCDCDGFTQAIALGGVGTPEAGYVWFDAYQDYCLNSYLLYCIAPFGSVFGDPHFVGFNGCKFNFDGSDGGVYAIYSDADLQVNALLKRISIRGVEGTWMSKIGVRTVDVAVIFDPLAGVFNVDDMTLAAALEDVLHFNATKVQMRVNHESGLISEMAVVTPHVRINVDVKRFGKGSEDFFLNIDILLLAQPLHPHGVLGQTAANMKNSDAAAADATVDCSRSVAGTEDDYIVSDGLVGTQFTFRQFKDSPATVAARRVYRNSNLNSNNDFTSFPAAKGN